MARIYIIKSDLGDKCYIGSTTSTLNERYIDHLSDYNCERLTCTSQELFNEYGTEYCYYKLLEECSIEDRFIRERYWFENTPNCVNVRIPFRTKEETKEKQKQWWQNNTGRYNNKTLARNITYITCECGMEIQKGNRSRHLKSGHLKK